MCIVMGKEITRDLLRRSPSGISCRFVKIDDCLGIKFYHDEKMRDICWERQKAAYKVGLGPYAGGKIDIEECGQKLYGHVTEVVDVFYDEEYRELRREYSWNLATDEHYNFNQKFEKLWAGLISDLRRSLKTLTGFEFGDDHYGNLGFKDGKLICIDFGY